MEHYAGIDVSLELLSVCIVDAKGKIVREAKVASDPDPSSLFCGVSPGDRADRARSRTVIAMAARRIDQRPALKPCFSRRGTSRRLFRR